VGHGNGFHGFKDLMSEEKMQQIEALSVVHHRVLVLAGLDVMDYVTLPPLPHN
jgi:hypothetical protein